MTPSLTFWEMQLIIRDGSKPIRVTVVWSDSASLEGSEYRVRNDLNVGAYQSACFPCWVGNNFNSFSGYSNAGLVTGDSINNIEEIIIPPNYYATGSALRVYVQVQNLVADGIDPNGSTIRQDFGLFVDNAYE